MTLYKKATLKSETTISSHAYVCGSCGHTEVARKRASQEKTCPKCKGTMSLMSSQESD